ncbi:hypothetical protein PTI98_009228 [Pleurotus ostreatus]|nr:hypothetical protein PTI98_009228 [Pleurotus ostreatus]
MMLACRLVMLSTAFLCPIDVLPSPSSTILPYLSDSIHPFLALFFNLTSGAGRLPFLLTHPSAASLAALSALSFPSTPSCPGIQRTVSLIPAFLLRAAANTVWLALRDPMMAAWLSTYMLADSIPVCRLISSIPNTNAAHSPLYTVQSFSVPSLILSTPVVAPFFVITAAAPTCPLYPEPSVYTFILVLSLLSALTASILDTTLISCEFPAHSPSAQYALDRDVGSVECPARRHAHTETYTSSCGAGVRS